MRIIPFILLLTLVACGTIDNQISLSDLKKQVLDVHDEVMPKMGELRRTAIALREKAGQTENEVEIAEYNDAASAIEEANEAMMNWMRNFNPDFEGTDPEIRDYLDQQKNDIATVRVSMNTSLEKGLALINR